MKLTGKIVLCAALALLAVACLLATLTSLGVLGARAVEQNEYLLKEYQQNVCVFQLPDTKNPAVVTNIAVDTLPSADRAELKEGIAVADWTELVLRLEDLGS